MSKVDSKYDLNIENWTAERLRKMHEPIVRGTWMEGCLTPHRYLTQQIESLLISFGESLKVEYAAAYQKEAVHHGIKRETPHTLFHEIIERKQRKLLGEEEL